MISPELVNQMIATQKVSAATRIIAVADPLAADTRWVAGTELKATVLAALPNGWYRVKISDLLLELNLPRNTQPGEQLDLTFVKNQPRLTFLYNPPTPSGLNETRTQVDLSAGAKWLAQILNMSPPANTELSDSPPLTTQTAIQRFTPLLQQPQTSSAVLAQTLQTQIENSGLFYESHQTQWLLGQRTLTQLRQEPQAQQFQQFLQQRLSEMALSSGLEQAAHSSHTTLLSSGIQVASILNQAMAGVQHSDEAGAQSLPSIPSTTVPLAPEKENLRHLFQALRHPTAAAELAHDSSHPTGLTEAAEATFDAVVPSKVATASVPDNVLRQVQQEFIQQSHVQHLVQQQLQLLSEGKLVWQGLLWGDQWLEWEINPDEQRSSTEDSNTEVDRYWQTTLKLTLPQLGALQATLRLNVQGRVQMQLQTAQSESAERLRQAQTTLNDQFAAAGLQLDYSQIDANLLTMLPSKNHDNA